MSTLTPKQAGLLETALLALIIVPPVLLCCAVGIALDIHQTRVELTASNTEWRRETLTRLDRLLWKADTALEVAGGLRLDLGNTLTKLRAQVKQASDESTKATAVQTKAAAVTVAKALDTTRQAIEAVAGEPSTPAAVEPAAAMKPPITVDVPPPTVIAEKPPEPPKVEIQERPPKRRRWYTHFWRWW